MRQHLSLFQTSWSENLLPVCSRFGRLDEAGDRRITPRRPVRLSTQQTAVAPGDEHDDRRVHPREMSRAAVVLRTQARVSYLDAPGRGAAAGAIHREAGLKQFNRNPVATGAGRMIHRTETQPGRLILAADRSDARRTSATSPAPPSAHSAPG